MKNLYLRNRLCFPIKGFNRAIVYDLNRKDYYFIPIPLYRKIEKDNVISFDYAETEQWEEFLTEKEIIFTIDTPNENKLFPSVSTNFEIPNLLSSLILHDNLNQTLLEFLGSMHILNVSVIADRYSKKTIEFLQKLSTFEIDSIYLYLPESNRAYDDDEFVDLSSIRQLFNVYLFDNSQKTENKKEKHKFYDLINIVMLPYSFSTFSSAMLPEKMQINYNHFFESYNNHNYFNQKLYIDKEGSLKNGLNNKDSFGNINSITEDDFLKLIGSEKFQKLWNVKKEETLVCKDCEFRYMCVDPRVPTQNENGNWFHTEECNYNPYISKWNYEKDYRDLKSSGITLDKNGNLNIDKDKLTEVFTSIWGT